MPPKKIIQSISRFEGDPISRAAQRERSAELSDAEVAQRNAMYDSALYGEIDSRLDSEQLDKIKDHPEEPSEKVSSGGDVENFYTKIENETEDAYRDVLAQLSAQGVPESVINDSGRTNIRKRVLSEVERISESNQETLDDDSVGGRILPDEARRRVVRAVVSEEIMSFYHESPQEALKALPAETIRDMYGHLPGGATEMRTNEDLSLFGREVESYHGGDTLESQVEEILADEVDVKTDGDSVDQTREQVLDIYEDAGGDIDAKSKEMGLGDGDEMALDSEMISADNSTQESLAIGQIDSR